jgi:hypothetical protein
MESNNNKPLALADYIKLFNTHFAIAYLASGVVVIDENAADEDGKETVDFRSVEGFKQFNANVLYAQTKQNGETSTVEFKSVADAWMKSPQRRTYKGIVFNPRWVTGGVGADDSVYNLWMGFQATPIAGSTVLFWNHVKEVICAGDEELYSYIRKWIAHIVQKPATLPKTSLVLRGLQGTGKNSFVGPVGALVGKSFGEYTDMEKVVGRFTGHLKNKLIIHANEATWGGDKKKEGILKALITDKERAVEMKGKDVFSVKNYARLIISSNNDWVTPVGLDDRRFVFCNVSSKRKTDPEYFKALREEIGTEEEGYKPEFLNALLNDLFQEELSQFSPQERPQSNAAAGWDLKVMSMSSHQSFIYEWLNRGEMSHYDTVDGMLGFHKLRFSDFYTQYENHCDKYKDNFMLKQKAFSMKTFGKMIPIEGDSRKDSKSRYYIVPNMNECRKFFEEKVVYQSVPWDNPIEKTLGVIHVEKNKLFAT